MLASLKPGSYVKGRFIYFTICLLLVIVTYKLFDSYFIISTELTASPRRDKDYVSLQSIAANYTLLKNDKANSQFIQQRLLAFEHDLPPLEAPSDLVNAYRIKYYNLLKKYELSSLATTIDPEIIFKVAAQSAPLIDNYYLDNKIFPERNSTPDFRTDSIKASLLHKVLEISGIDLVAIKKDAQTKTKIPSTLSIKGIVGGRALLVADCSQPDCTLVFSLAQDSGWHAFVNGEATPLVKENMIVTTTVPRGISRVWLVHEDWINLLSEMLSMSALLIFILFWQYEILNRMTVR